MADFQGLASLGAAKAYKTAQDLDIGKGQGLGGLQPEKTTPSFEALVERTVENTLSTVRGGDAAVRAGLQGNLPTQQVVEAVMSMESAVKTTVAVRNRLIEAYQDIMKMSV